MTFVQNIGHSYSIICELRNKAEVSLSISVKPDFMPNDICMSQRMIVSCCLIRKIIANTLLMNNASTIP